MDKTHNVQIAEPETASLTTFERRTMLKVDFWILPCVSITFLLSFLDKTNIANANVFGLSRDLHLHGNDFNNCLVILFVAFAVFDIPATLMMRKVRPSIWLPTCTILFGLISMTQGSVSSYSGLLAARFFLGMAEAVTFSGCFYLLSQWYRREEAQKRFSLFYASSQLAGAFGGLLASAIGLMDGERRFAAWRWVFIVEGAVTAAIGGVLFLVMPDFPQQTKWLSAEERQCILSRLETNDEIAETPLTLRKVFATIATPKILISGFLYGTLLIPAYAYAFFTPTIIKSYTAGTIHTQLLSVPPWACAWVFSMLIAYFSDRLRHRFLFVVLPLLLTIPGYAMLLTIHNQPKAQYGAVFLVALGVWSPLPVVVCWGSMNVHGRSERGIALGWIIGVAQLSGIPAVYLFLARDAPHYVVGYRTCTGCVVSGIALACSYAFVCRLENSRIGRSEGQDVKAGGGRSPLNVL